MGVSSALGYSALLPAGLGFRNAIINGEMEVHQRTGTITIGGASTYTLDRWVAFSSGTFTVQQSTDAPPGEAFTNSLLATCTAADTSIASTDFNAIQQIIEGYTSAQLGFGKVAKDLVLSFWVKSSLTGTYCVAFRNSATNRSYVAEYQISSANTWEKKTIYLKADSSGTWETTNGIGVRLSFSLAMGSNYFTTPGVWSNGSLTATANQVNWMSSASSRTFQLTGVQLEANYQETPFEHRPFPVELSLCQRYFEKSYDINTAIGTATAQGSYSFTGLSDGGGRVYQSIFFSVPKRHASYNWGVYTTSGAPGEWSFWRNGASGTVAAIGGNRSERYVTVNNALSIGALWTAHQMSCHWFVDAEL